MHKSEKERVIAELTERLRTSPTLIVADYRGLTMPEIDGLRGELLKHGARFSVVKNTLTRRAAEAAGADAVLTMLEGPTAIAFLESEGDPVAVAKALSDAARTTKILVIRGGVLDGKTITADDVDNLAKLPPLDQLRGQVLGAITAPLTTIIGLFSAPLQNLIGLIDARIEQLQAQGDTFAAEAAPAEESAPEPEPNAHEHKETEPETELEPEPNAHEHKESEPEAEAEPEPAAEAEPEPEAEAAQTEDETTTTEEPQED
ncbi:MAG: 50S ribosomal protein L10 [Gaiellaceae bacterium]